MDILYYAGMLKYNAALNSNINIKTNRPNLVTLAQTFSIPAPPSGPIQGLAQLNTCWQCLCSNLLQTTIPTACGFMVCDTSGYARCGATCSWTVPSGVTRAQFMLWGPGGSTGSTCCCGGSFFGPTGAFAVVNIPVTAGCAYTICAGCAYCCYASQTTVGVIGCPTFVTGFNLSGVCALSGISCMLQYNLSNGGNNSSLNWWSNNNCSYSTCVCDCDGVGWDFCGGPSSTISSDYSLSKFSVSYGSVSGSNATIYGIPGMYPRMCMLAGFGSSPSYTMSAPIFGFPYTSMCCYCYSSGAIISNTPTAINNRTPIPGQGGWPASIFGGNDAASYTGDSGRMGAVCISYC